MSAKPKPATKKERAKAIGSKQKNDIKKQVLYVCEGFIKTVEIKGGKVSFALEPAAPYLFEKKEDDGKIKKLILFVDDLQKPDSARIVGDKKEALFSVPSGKYDLSAMLIAKANRLRVRATSSLDAISKCPISVKALTVL